MTKYREILRLKNLGFSDRNIARSCSVSRNTVKRVIDRADELSISWPLDFGMTDGALKELLFPSDKSATDSRLPDYKAVEPGFADDVLQRSDASEGEDLEVSMLYSRAAVTNSLMDKIAAKCHIKAPDNGAATEQTRDIERDLQKAG